VSSSRKVNSIELISCLALLIGQMLSYLLSLSLLVALMSQKVIKSSLVPQYSHIVIKFDS